MTATILIVEDESIVALDLQTRLESMGYRVPARAATGEEAVALALDHAPDLVLMDIHLGPGIDGIVAATRIREARDLPVVFLTAFADEATLERARDAAPYGYLLKPFQELSLRSTLDMALLRHRLEGELKAREARLHALLFHSHELVALLDERGRFTYASPAIVPMLGYREDVCLGMPFVDLLSDEDRPRWAGELATALSEPQGARTAAFRARTAQGSWKVLEAVLRNGLELPGVGALILNARDVSERVAAEEERHLLERQVQQAQKLESLGVLAGGIAHDFNNLLMGVMGQAGLALLDLPQGHPSRDRVNRIELAAQRAAELTSQMLAYSGRGRFAFAKVDLSRLVQEMAQLLDTVISKKAALKLELAADLPSIEGDPAQLRQVVMNLLTNASDALGDKGGLVRVRTGAMTAKADTPCLVGQAPPGHMVWMEVHDEGSGMDADTLQRIFDPFFTTKFTGRGLGLAAVQGILRGHKGGIQVKSTPGKGTTFRLLFPASADAHAPLPAPIPAAPLPTGSGLVLVVDDEPYVREVAQATLERQGFTVLTAEDGEAGLALFQAHQGAVKALLLDLTMPRMGGEELLRRIRTGGGPDVPALLSSGYTQEQVDLHSFPGRPPRFLRKPYQPQELVEVISGMIREENR